MTFGSIDSSYTRRTLTSSARALASLKVDGPLLVGLSLIAIFGLIVLYSASGRDLATVLKSATRLGIGAIVMLLLCHALFRKRTAS